MRLYREKHDLCVSQRFAGNHGLCYSLFNNQQTISLIVKSFSSALKSAVKVSHIITMSHLFQMRHYGLLIPVSHTQHHNNQELTRGYI